MHHLDEFSEAPFYFFRTAINSRIVGYASVTFSRIVAEIASGYAVTQELPLPME